MAVAAAILVAVLARLLRNLKRNWLAREDYRRALATVDLLRTVSPEDVRELRDRGILQQQFVQIRQGLQVAEGLPRDSADSQTQLLQSGEFEHSTNGVICTSFAMLCLPCAAGS